MSDKAQFHVMSDAELEAMGPMIRVGVRQEIEVPKTIYIAIIKGNAALEYNLTEKTARELMKMISDAIEGRGCF